MDVPTNVLTGLAQLEHEPDQLLELATISAQWQIALDVAAAALLAAVGLLNPSELGLRGNRLANEPRETAYALNRLARVAGVPPPLPTGAFA